MIDWGGSGKPMVLLTGLGDNAHVFDNFAYQFTDYFHVYGITRRGFLPSSQPRTATTCRPGRADDIAVLDALGIRKAVFAGHSLAGSELSRLGAAYRIAVEKLIYLDASDLAERFGRSARAAGIPAAVHPATLKSLQAYQAASARYLALREPDQAVCLNLVRRRGRDRRCHVPDWVTDKLLAGVRARPIRRRTGRRSRRRGSASSPLSPPRRGRPGTGT